MSPNRYAVLFKPGDYTDAGLFKIPFYVHIVGLGKTPYDVKLSNIHTPPHLRDGNGTCTFWRSAENFSIVGPATYDEPEQSAYMSHDGKVDGYAAYKVADNVKSHDAKALGIYDVIIHDIRIENSVESPDNDGVTFTNLCNNSLSNPGPRGIGYLINGKVKSTYDTWRDNLVRIKKYPADGITTATWR